MTATFEERFWAKVNKTDGCWLWMATDVNGYGRVSRDARMVLAHRAAWELQNGPIPAGMFVDHRCHNRGCVNPEHLRLATNKQNQENRAGPSTVCNSGVRGVRWNKRDRRWIARVGHHGENIYVGSFTSKAEAERAVVAKRLELFTHNDTDRIAS